MRTLLRMLVMTLLAASPLAAQAGTTVMVPVKQFVDAFNKGDTTTAAAACSEETSIIDEFPPHEWHGAGACAAWMRDYNADAKRNGIAGGFVTLGRPRHLDVHGDRAYVVIPSSYTYSRQGKPMKESGAAFTFALRKMPAGWRITGWSWAKN